VSAVDLGDAAAGGGRLAGREAGGGLNGVLTQRMRRRHDRGEVEGRRRRLVVVARGLHVVGRARWGGGRGGRLQVMCRRCYAPCVDAQSPPSQPSI
jgi:hypothetical protein